MPTGIPAGFFVEKINLGGRLNKPLERRSLNAEDESGDVSEELVWDISVGLGARGWIKP